MVVCARNRCCKQSWRQYNQERKTIIAEDRNGVWYKGIAFYLPEQIKEVYWGLSYYYVSETHGVHGKKLSQMTRIYTE